MRKQNQDKMGASRPQRCRSDVPGSGYCGLRGIVEEVQSLPGRGFNRRKIFIMASTVLGRSLGMPPSANRLNLRREVAV
jgi:hypothetical protein